MQKISQRSDLRWYGILAGIILVLGIAIYGAEHYASAMSGSSWAYSSGITSKIIKLTTSQAYQLEKIGLPKGVISKLAGCPPIKDCTWIPSADKDCLYVCGK